MTISLSDDDRGEGNTTAPGRSPIEILARARAECLALGIAPAELGNLLLDEAALSWLMADLDENDVKSRLRRVFQHDMRIWMARAHRAAGQCDCVREVHFAGIFEAASGAPNGAHRDGLFRGSSIKSDDLW